MGTSHKVCLTLHVHGPSHLRTVGYVTPACTHITESCRAGQRKMFLVRLHHGDLTQGLPDFTVHDTCPWPLPPEDRWLCHTCMHSYTWVSHAGQAKERCSWLGYVIGTSHKVCRTLLFMKNVHGPSHLRTVGYVTPACTHTPG